MLQRWWFPSTFALILALIVLGPALGPGALLNLDLVGVEHWPTPSSMWGIGPELPRSVPAELFFAAVASFTSGATAMKLWFVLCISGSFLAMFRLLRGLDTPSVAWYAGGVAYAINPFLLTRLAVGHTTLAGVYAIAPLVLPILLRGSSRRPQVVLASAALAFMGFFGGLIWGIATLFGLASGRRPSPAILGASFCVHLPWLLPSIFLLSDNPDLVVNEVFRPGGDLVDVLSLATGYGFWQPILEVGTEKGWLTSTVGVLFLTLAAFGSPLLRVRFGFPSLLAVVVAGAAIALINRTGAAVDWIFDLPGSSVAREPHRFLVLVIWWIVPASILGTQRALKSLSRWSESDIGHSGLLVPAAFAALLIAPAVWGLHENVRPVDVPDGWQDARSLTKSTPGTVLVLPWNRYIDVSFANNRRVLNPALRYFGPDVIHGGQLGVPSAAEAAASEPDTDVGREAVDARITTLRQIVDAIPDGTATASDFAAHGIEWILVLHEVDYRGFLTLTDTAGLDHQIANERLDLFQVAAPDQIATPQTVGQKFPGYLAADDEDRVLASASNRGWIGTDGVTSNGLAQLPAGSSAWHYRSFVVILGWVLAAFTLVAALRKSFTTQLDND